MKRRLAWLNTIEAYLYLLPTIILLFLFTYYPFTKTIYSSFFLVNAMGQIKEFVGLDNYAHVLGNAAFVKSIGNTLYYVAVTVPSYILIALILALIANKKTRSSTVYEMLFALTMAMSISVNAMIFQLLYNPTIGAINYLFKTEIHWLGDSHYAMLAIIFIEIWMSIGYHFLFLLAAIRSVPSEMLESASIDGANRFRRTLHIILPMISPILFFLVISSLAKHMLMSGLTIILTQGGPKGSTETMISFMYKQIVNNMNYNDAYASAIITFVLVFIMMLIGFRFEKKGVHYS